MEGELKELQVRVATIDAKLNGLITLQSNDSEAIKQQLKSQTEYLKGEVHRALNSHSEIKEKILLNTLKVSELEKKEYQCPIIQVKENVDTLMAETEESRAMHKFPDIRKGMKIWDAIKTVSIIIVAGAAIASFILTIKQIRDTSTYKTNPTEKTK